MTLNIKRLTDEPIIHAGLSELIGTNINGASLVRAPDWVKAPLGRYYLYFAHHEGRYIRMAYADNLSGPWKIHEPGVLDVEASYFVTEDLTSPNEGGRKRETEGDSESLLASHEGEFLYAHIASPDVHVDDGRQIIRMYYHGLLDNGKQQTRLAISRNGIDFVAEEPLLGICYFRVFEYGDLIYAIGWGGKLLRSKSWSGPFESGPSLFQESPFVSKHQTIRHVAVRLRGDQLDLFYTCIGDFPEVIRRSEVTLHSDWGAWEARPSEVILVPERSWEGGDLPKIRSAIGAVNTPVHALRDSCVFEEEGQCYLLYCGAGESCIGIAQIVDH